MKPQNQNCISAKTNSIFPKNFLRVIFTVSVISGLFLLISYLIFNVTDVNFPFKEALSITATVFGGVGTLYAVLIGIQTLEENSLSDQKNSVNLIRQAQPILKLLVSNIVYATDGKETNLDFDLMFLCFKNECYDFNLEINVVNEQLEKNLDNKFISVKTILYMEKLRENHAKVVLGIDCWENQILSLEDGCIELKVNYIDVLQNSVTSYYKFQFKKMNDLIKDIRFLHKNTEVLVSSGEKYLTSDFLKYSKD